MKTKTKTIEEYTSVLSRLEFALQDSRNYPVSYPILARFGLMEKTLDGFKSIDPRQVRSRIMELILKLS